MEVTFEPVNPTSIDVYIQTGLQSYDEHYLYLWENKNPESYLSISFTHKTVAKELADSSSENYILKVDGNVAGVLKISSNKGYDQWIANDSLYLHRIYLLSAFSGKGIGGATLKFVFNRARELNKKVVWLEAMKTSKALAFYQKNGFKIVSETTIELKGIKPSEKEMWILTKEL